MKRYLWLLTPVLLLAMTATAFAGDGHACEASTQECLDYMATNYAKKGWAGLEYEHDEASGMILVTGIVADSPASKSGFAKGDYIVALNGIEYAEENHEKLMAAQKDMVPGSDVTFTVKRDGKHHDLAVSLGTMPDDVLAKLIGSHLMEGHVETAKAEEE